MVSRMLKSVGVVMTMLVFCALAIVTMYISYLLGIALLIGALLFITYHVLSIFQGHKSKPLVKKE